MTYITMHSVSNVEIKQTEISRQAWSKESSPIKTLTIKIKSSENGETSEVVLFLDDDCVITL